MNPAVTHLQEVTPKRVPYHEAKYYRFDNDYGAIIHTEHNAPLDRPTWIATVVRYPKPKPNNNFERIEGDASYHHHLTCDQVELLLHDISHRPPWGTTLPTYQQPAPPRQPGQQV